MDVCPVCLIDFDFREEQIDHTIFKVDCKRCGSYKIDSILVVTTLKEYGEAHFLSGLIRNKYEFGEIFHVTQESIKNLIYTASEPSSPFESIDLLIEYVYKKTKNIGVYVSLKPSEDYPIIYSKNDTEFAYILDKTIDLDLLESEERNNYRLSLRGWEKVGELLKVKKDNKRAFVAMWFDSSLDDVWENGFKVALENTGFKPIRIDFEEHNEKICDKIISEIKKSRLMIVDVTEHRHNVYFEAGYALGLGLDLIWTCRDDCIDDLKNIFDTRQYAHIVWSDKDDLKTKLINRIEATIK